MKTLLPSAANAGASSSAATAGSAATVHSAVNAGSASAGAALSSDATRRSLMDAAERLFAERGFDGASVRDITKAAKANLGAINYHFGTKDGLIMAVFTRRLKPLNEKRLAQLDAVEARAATAAATNSLTSASATGTSLTFAPAPAPAPALAPAPAARKLREASSKAPPASPVRYATPLPLEEVLDAFLRPMVEQHADDLENTQAFTRLMCRCFQEPNPQLKSLIFDQFGELVQRTNAALLRALPGLPPEEVFWRMCFLFGSAHHALDIWSRFATNPFASMPGAPHPRPLDRAALLKRLIAYAAAGLRGTAHDFSDNS